MFPIWIGACIGLMVYGSTTILRRDARPAPNLLVAGTLLGFAVLVLGFPCIRVSISSPPTGLLALMPFAPALAALLRGIRTDAEGRLESTNGARCSVVLTVLWAAFVVGVLLSSLVQSQVEHLFWAIGWAAGLAALVVGVGLLQTALRTRAEIDRALVFLYLILGAATPIPLDALATLFQESRAGMPARATEISIGGIASPLVGPALVAMTSLALTLILHARRMELEESADEADTDGDEPWA